MMMMELVWEHGSMSAAVTKVFSPVSTITMAVGRALKLWEPDFYREACSCM